MSDLLLSNRPIEVFISYAHKDDRLRRQLVEHLANLKRQGIISEWHDRMIIAGSEWSGEIDTHLNTALVILLLISPSFMASDYCNSVEVERAMQRHNSGDACVVPIILRPVDWTNTPFSKLEALPEKAKPVTAWQNRDKAFLNVTEGIRNAIHKLKARANKGQVNTISLTAATAPALNMEGGSTEKKTNIICSKPQPATLVQADWVFHYPQDIPSLKNYTVESYLVEFENQPLPGRNVTPVNDVQAQIIFYNAAGVEYVRVERGSWVKEPLGVVNLEVGRKKALVLFTWWLTENNELNVVSQQSNRDATNSRAKPTSVPLYGDWLRVYVRLISNGELIIEDNYKLTIKPDLAVTPIELKQEQVEQLAIAQQLNEFLNEGYQLIRGNPVNALSSWVVAKEWAAKVENYIREKRGEIHALDFSKEAPIIPYPHSAVNRRVVDWIYTRTERIGELIAELKKS